MEILDDMRIKKAKYEFVDWTVLISVFILAALGVLMVFSITGTSIFNNASGNRLSYMRHSAVGVTLGVIAMVFMAFVPNKWYKNLGGLILLGTILVFIVTPIIGLDVPSSPGVRRWLGIRGVFVFQAVDLARMGFTISLPWLIQRLINRRKYFSKKIWDHYLWALGFVVICAVLTFAQPDLGSGIVIFATGSIMFFSSGIHRRQIGVLFGIAAMLVGAVWFVGIDNIGLLGYQDTRIQAWMDPFNHYRGLQSRTGFISIALGGMTGVGLGNSTQALGFAIEPHTDLIVTILAEELGFVGVAVVMILYFVIAFKCFTTALKARDVFKALICIGVGSFFLTQPLVNLGGASGIIPLSGVTLPLISYGMTSKLSTFILIGIYFNMRRAILVDVARSKVIREMKNDELYENNILDFKGN